MGNVMVSVICICYNHELYIRSALDGFISQKTNFPFEVLVHDDASTDKTADIIREYAALYPNIIKPVFQAVNQYSKGIKIASTFLFPKMTGKYVAFCEGDDYWTDPNKLQMQVDFLETHPDYSASVHNTIFEYVKTGEKEVRYSLNDRDIIPSEVVKCGAHAYQTSSLVYRASMLVNQPEWVTMIPDVGDYPKSIYLVLSGKMRYFGAVMSVYRRGTPGSWTERIEWNKNIDNKILGMQKCVEMLNCADAYYGYKYTHLFKKQIFRFEYRTLLINREYKKLLHPRYCSEFRKENVRTRCYIVCKAFFPFAASVYEKQKEKKEEKINKNGKKQYF